MFWQLAAMKCLFSRSCSTFRSTSCRYVVAMKYLKEHLLYDRARTSYLLEHLF